MGAELSQEDYPRVAVAMYDNNIQYPSMFYFPDIGIDESLLKYSGANSNAQLTAYSDALVAVPGYIERLGSSLAALKTVPNAVGLGALVISMIMEICITSSTQADDNTPYSMLQRVFGEEKASAVRDTMSEYVKRHRRFMNNDQRLVEEIRRLEAQLSNHLTILRNSLLLDGQMSDRGLKIWVNGASFHLQMLIHEARLDVQTGKRASDYRTSIKAAISSYLQHLDNLLQKFKTHLTNNSQLFEFYWNHVFSNYKPITGLKSHFLNINNNLLTLINQHDAFPLPLRI